jgi:hypothetical protein
VFELATDAHGRKYYRSRTSTVPTEAPAPGIPFSINFLVEPGDGARGAQSGDCLPVGVAAPGLANRRFRHCQESHRNFARVRRSVDSLPWRPPS